jgi:hypothetical protein
LDEKSAVKVPDKADNGKVQEERLVLFGQPIWMISQGEITLSMTVYNNIR